MFSLRRSMNVWLRVLLVTSAALAWVTSANAVEIQSICRLKGQEPIRLRGIGLVTGLVGTGDTRFTPMHRAVQEAIKLQGINIVAITEVASVRNVALVQIACEIPGVGGRGGDRFDCFVSSIGTARSLAGGRLTIAPMQSPLLGDDTAYALAEGSITIEDVNAPNQARIEDGAQLIRDLKSPYVLCNDTITLVIDNSHASFVTANRISAAINRTFQPQLSRDGQTVRIAYAVDGRNVEVLIPEYTRDDAVPFVADLMQIPIFVPHTEARIIINEKTGTIVVTGEVEITPVLVSHRNLLLFPGATIAIGGQGAGASSPFAPLTREDPTLDPESENANLFDLLAALNRAQVSTIDKISIIRELAKTGKLHAKIIYE